MLVTFKTPAQAHVTMFGDVAKNMLEMMGQSGNVPGALLAEDVAPALQALKQEMASRVDDESHDALDQDEQHAAKPVALTVRAKPLIDLLQSAIDGNETVVWESD